jgi:hypothetical protein
VLDEMTPLNSSEIERIASAAATAAVEKTLLAMGVDVSKPEAIQEMQRDFAHVRIWRQSVDTVRRQSLVAAVGILLSGIAGAVWMAISFKGH